MASTSSSRTHSNRSGQGDSVAGQISVFQPAVGDAATLRHSFEAEPWWLPEARPTTDGDWLVGLSWGRIRRSVVTRVGQPWAASDAVWRSLSWDPTTASTDRAARPLDRLLPAFDGEIGLHLRPDAPSLMVDGRYQPPGGDLGAAIDELAFHRVARATLQSLLGGIAHHLAPVEDPASRSA